MYVQATGTEGHIYACTSMFALDKILHNLPKGKIGTNILQSGSRPWGGWAWTIQTAGEQAASESHRSGSQL